MEATATQVPSPTAELVPAMLATPTPSGKPGTLRAAILFERAGDIWSLDASCGETHLVVRGLQAGDPSEVVGPWALAPNGQLLARAQNTAGGQAVLQLIALPDGQPREVGRYEGRIDILCWSHDASRLAFLINRQQEQTGEVLEQSLRLYDVTSQESRVLYERTFQPEETERTTLWPRAWAPGDAALYVVMAVDRTNDPGTLYAVDAGGGEPRLISSVFLLVGGQAVHAPSGRVLVRRPLAANEVDSSPIYVAHAGRDGSLSAITPLSPADWFVGAVAWSPDGLRVVVERLEPQEHGSFGVHLWLLMPDGASPRQLTADEGYREEQPIWTPDGTGIVFSRWRVPQPELGGLWTLGLDDRVPRLCDEAGTNPQASTGA